MRLVALCLIANLACASSSILSTTKKEGFELERRHNELTTKNQTYSWISPVVGSYSYNIQDDRDDKITSKAFQISIDQPIFKSGGIYYGIKYAQSNKKYLDFTTSSSEQATIKQAINLVLTYRKLQIQMQSLKLQIENALIDIERKKEQYENGLIDSSDLDQAMLSKNSLEHSLIVLQQSQFQAIRDFEALSDSDIEQVLIPEFVMVDEAKFKEYSLEIKRQQELYERSSWESRGAVSEYLPTISLNASYNDRREEYKANDRYYYYGIKISMPLFDFNMMRTVELKRVEMLKNALGLQDVKRSESSYFKSTNNDVMLFWKKRDISNENYKLYDELLNSTVELASAGEKTSHDVDTLRNSRDTMMLEAKGFEIDAQIKLLELYAKMYGKI